MVALFSLLGVIAVSLVITRVATVVLTATGLSREEARFQARSALTGTGFTTSEAEAVVTHPIRRRVVMFLMLLGNAGVVAAASTLIIGFRPGGTRDYWLVIQLFGGLILLVMLSRSRWVDRRLTKLIARALERWTDLPTRDEATLLALSGDWAVSELRVREGDLLDGRTVGELEGNGLPVRLLGITRRHGDYEGRPEASSRVEAGDLLIVYGREPEIDELDCKDAGVSQPSGSTGSPTRTRPGSSTRA